MTVHPTLVVPIALDALMITPAVKGENTFRIWPRTYRALEDYAGLDPDVGDRQLEDSQFTAAGVHLHWTLPRGLRHGTQDPRTGRLRYPLVPNRWLLTRFSGTTDRRMKAWVIESDCPHSTYARKQGHDAAHSSDFLVGQDTLDSWHASADPYRNQVKPRKPEPGFYQLPLGLAFPADTPGAWSERAAADRLFLTALGPGDPYFPTYVPHNSNVFSFVDEVTDLGTTTLGYHLLGWYSNPDADLLAPSADTSYADLLTHLNWRDPRLTGDPGHDAAVEPATRSLYCGHVLSVAWEPDATTAPSDDPLRRIRDEGRIDVALANSTEDAFAALAGRAQDNAGRAPSAGDMQVLRAFLHGLLPLADEKGGDARIRRRIHAGWFAASAGSHRWTVTPPPTTDETPPAFAAPAWLDTLNDDQHHLDAQLSELSALQWQLNALWLKNGIYANLLVPPGDAPDPQQMQDHLDPGLDGSLAQRVQRRTSAVRDLVAKVPQPDPGGSPADAQEALRSAIDAFAADRGLPPGAMLTAVPRNSFWQSNNPAVTVSGVLPPPDTADTDQPLSVRLVIAGTSGLIAAVMIDGTPITVTPGNPPMPEIPSSPSFPDLLEALLGEFFLLDPGSAAALAAATGLPADKVTATLTAHRPGDYTGTLPALGPTLWSQPWQPVFMEWKVAYLPIPYSVGDQRCWSFDGTDYRFTPGTARLQHSLDDIVEVGGITGLGPHPRSLFAARLEKYVADHGTADQAARLDEWLGNIGEWSFLSQELSGFNELLAARTGRASRRPTPNDEDFPHIARLAGYSDAATADDLPARYLDRVRSVPYLPAGSDAQFQEFRQGQIYLSQLFLYDKFGRILDVVNASTEYGGLHDYQNFPLVVDNAFTTATSLAPKVAAVAQLPPRPLQPARLDFDLLDGMTARRIVGTAAEASPIGGWLLPSHLDHSLLLYDPTGTLLGTYRLVSTRDGQIGRWDPPPEGAITGLDQVAARAPVVAGLLGSAQLASPANFTAFLDAIDSTLWTTDPLGARADKNLSVLIGRPLALVPAQLRLSLDGPPLFDTGWAATLEPPQPQFTTHEFAVRLGDRDARDDGLVGYFTGKDGVYRYDRFHSVTEPDDQQDFLTQIGPLGPRDTPSDASYLQLTFADPAPTEVLLLMDPYAAVHAVTGITPTTEVSVPAAHRDTPLAHIEALFRFGPILTTCHDPDTGGGSIAFPQPADKQGSWTWLRPALANTAWTPFALTPAAPNAQFPDDPSTLQDGLLRFTTDLEETPTPPERKAQP
ncbi:hypothetical protein ABIA39_003344 [Nocardia sp. GAS34]|uniref:hypothetical protein n=1 Tax=unclassified Nocardia TaxID=2637762 RepID=UPI003D21F306